MLRCVGRGFVYAEISNLRNIADPWMLDLKVKSMLMSWEFFYVGYIVIEKLHLSA